MFIIGAKLCQIKITRMMKTYDESAQINHNPNWPYIPDHSYRILVIAGSGLGKTSALLNLTKLTKL